MSLFAGSVFAQFLSLHRGRKHPSETLQKITMDDASRPRFPRRFCIAKCTPNEGMLGILSTLFFASSLGKTVDFSSVSAHFPTLRSRDRPDTITCCMPPPPHIPLSRVPSLWTLPPVSHLVAVWVIRSTVATSRCLCPSHPYFTSQQPQSTRVEMLASWTHHRGAGKCLLRGQSEYSSIF